MTLVYIGVFIYAMWLAGERGKRADRRFKRRVVDAVNDAKRRGLLR